MQDSNYSKIFKKNSKRIIAIYCFKITNMSLIKNSLARFSFFKNKLNNVNLIIILLDFLIQKNLANKKIFKYVKAFNEAFLSNKNTSKNKNNRI